MSKNPFGKDAIVSGRDKPTGNFYPDIGHNKKDRFVSVDGKIFDSLENTTLPPVEVLELINRHNNFITNVMHSYARASRLLDIKDPKHGSEERAEVDKFELNRQGYIKLIHGKIN